MKRISPLADVVPVYDTEFSDYPDGLRVMMDNGHAKTYRLEEKLPAPVLREPLERFEKVCFGGYQYKARRKRPGKWDGERRNSNG